MQAICSFSERWKDRGTLELEPILCALLGPDFSPLTVN